MSDSASLETPLTVKFAAFSVIVGASAQMVVSLGFYVDVDYRGWVIFLFFAVFFSVFLLKLRNVARWILAIRYIAIIAFYLASLLSSKGLFNMPLAVNLGIVAVFTAVYFTLMLTPSARSAFKRPIKIQSEEVLRSVAGETLTLRPPKFREMELYFSMLAFFGLFSIIVGIGTEGVFPQNWTTVWTLFIVVAYCITALPSMLLRSYVTVTQEGIILEKLYSRKLSLNREKLMRWNEITTVEETIDNFDMFTWFKPTTILRIKSGKKKAKFVSSHYKKDYPLFEQIVYEKLGIDRDNIAAPWRGKIHPTRTIYSKAKT